MLNRSNRYNENVENENLENDHLDSYRLYSNLFALYAKKSPQRQGLAPKEFEQALNDPLVATTRVESMGRQLEIPQLVPIEHNPWLNADYYKKSFPKESESGNVLHYVDIPEIEPGNEVRDRLIELARSGGILAFDHPLSDPSYPQRVKSLLKNLDINIAEEKILGNQTYFAGQVKLKKIEDLQGSPLGFIDAYDTLVRDGEYAPERYDNGASLRTNIEEEQAASMRNFYEQAYQVLNDHPCNQGLSPDEFMAMMTEKDWVTKLVNSKDGQITALCLMDANLEELSWVNADYYKSNFPDKAANNQIVWFPGLAANPNSNVAGNTKTIVNLIAELVEKGNNEILVVFDSCDINTGFLDKFLDEMINDTPQASIDIKPIAVQRYSALRLSVA